MIIVRNQDGTRIAEYKAIDLGIKKILGDYKIETSSDSCGGTIEVELFDVLGSYETEKRAKNVMSMIERHIAAMHNDVNNRMNPIFTMPEK